MSDVKIDKSTMDYMSNLYKKQLDTPPTDSVWMILIEDTEVNGIVLKAGTYVNGVRQCD